MRVGILTASRTNNNGTDLQCAAMYKLFTRAGAQAEVIDYACTKLDRSRKLLLKFSPSQIIRLPWQIFQNISRKHFRKRSFVKSPSTYYPDTLKLDRYDAVVVGSDQIWNLKITGGDVNFFLPPHTGNIRRYSYAASLGKTDISDWEDKYGLSQLLKGFSGVSTREASGVEALRAIGVEAREDLDPILCMTNDEWAQLAKPVTRKKKYVLIYIVEKCPEAIEAAKAYAKRNGCKIIRVGNINKPLRGIRTRSFLSVGKWIGLMRGAQVVFTNSYHGLSTAIALNTNFRLFSLVDPKHNTRSLCLLKKLGLEQYAWLSDECRSDGTPEWTRTEQTLALLRERSMEYIQSMLQ